MLDTLSRKVEEFHAKYYLAQQHEADTVRLTEEHAVYVRALRERVWNALIPPSAVETQLKPWGVRYLHPTKGWKSVGKKRFAVRGVL